MSVKQDSRLLVKAFFFLAIVDTINGFFLNKGIASPIGIIFKAFILLVACKMLSSLPKFKGLLFLLVFIFHFFNDYHSEYRFSNRCNHHPFAEIRKCCFYILCSGCDIQIGKYIGKENTYDILS